MNRRLNFAGVARTRRFTVRCVLTRVASYLGIWVAASTAITANYTSVRGLVKGFSRQGLHKYRASSRRSTTKDIALRLASRTTSALGASSPSLTIRRPDEAALLIVLRPAAF